MSVELSSLNLAHLAVTTLRGARVGEAILQIGVPLHQSKFYCESKSKKSYKCIKDNFN